MRRKLRSLCFGVGISRGVVWGVSSRRVGSSILKVCGAVGERRVRSVFLGVRGVR